MRAAFVLLRCLDTTAEGPEREARFEWRVCRMHAREIRKEYDTSGDVRIESEEPV